MASGRAATAHHLHAISQPSLSDNSGFDWLPLELFRCGIRGVMEYPQPLASHVLIGGWAAICPKEQLD